MARTITRKISLSGTKLTDVNKANGRLFVGRVAGIALGFKENVHAQYGISHGLTGTFRAIMADGSEVNAPVVWGPGILIEPVFTALKGGAESVTVCADVYAVASETSPVGFMYVLETHGDDKDDPVTALLVGMPAMPALPAPSKEKTKTK